MSVDHTWGYNITKVGSTHQKLRNEKGDEGGNACKHKRFRKGTMRMSLTSYLLSYFL